MGRDLQIPENGAVPSTDFVRHFATYAQRARQSPVLISHHGRVNVALCDIALVRAGEAGFENSDLNRLRAKLDTILDTVSTHIFLVDGQGYIQRLNRAARQYMEVGEAELRGKRLSEVAQNSNLPMLERVVARVHETGVPETFEMSSQWYERTRFVMTICPYPGGVAIFADNVTAFGEMREGDEQRVATEAAAAKLGIAQGQVDVEGRIARSSPELAALLNRDGERLSSIRLVTLFEPLSRDAAEAALRLCLGGRDATVAQVVLLTSRGTMPLRVAFATIMGPIVPIGVRFMMVPA